jgi:hypothetical protein
MEVPKIFEDVEEKMILLTKNRSADFTIGGGSLSNLYMGRDLNDIDIFMNYNPEVKEIKRIFGEDIDIEAQKHLDDYGDEFSIPYLYRIKYKGYKIELIISSYFRIFEFDFRFRNFFYRDGIVYADKKAIEDIENKVLTILNPHTPICTLFRAFRFQEEFGFSIDEESFAFLEWFITKSHVTLENTLNYIERREYKISPSAKEKLLDYVHSHTENINGEKMVKIPESKFPFSEHLEEVVYQMLKSSNDHSCFSIYYEDLKKYDFVPFSFSFDLEYEFFKPKVEKVHQIIQSNRLTNITEPNTIPDVPMIKTKELKDKWQEYFNWNDLIKFLRRYHHQRHFINSLTLFHPMEEKLEVEIKPDPILLNRVNIGDILTGNILLLTVNKDFHYLIRKCTNGKYTISGMPNSASTPGAFYLEFIGCKVKEMYPEFFDFYNPDLIGLQSYPFQNDIFFADHHRITEIYHHTFTRKVPIRIQLPNKDTVDSIF